MVIQVISELGVDNILDGMAHGYRPKYVCGLLTSAGVILLNDTFVPIVPIDSIASLQICYKVQYKLRQIFLRACPLFHRYIAMIG